MVMVFFYLFCSLKSHVYCRKCVVNNKALIRFLKSKENERENSNELCKTKLYYYKDYLCLHAARTLRARRTLI